MKRIERTLAIIGAALLLLLGSAVATQAGNGSALKFGKVNKGTKTTTLQVTSGSASPLKLQGNSAAAPIVTNMTGQVANLNASMVGGANMNTYTFQYPGSTSGDLLAIPYTVPETGTYLVSLYANALPVLGAPASAASPSQFVCYVYDGASNVVVEAQNIDVGNGFWRALSASRVWTITSASASLKNMYLYCHTDSGSGWNVPSGAAGVVISYTKIPAAATTTLTPPALSPVAGQVPSRQAP